MQVHPTASYTLTLRVRIPNQAGVLGQVASAIGEAGGDIGAVDIVEVSTSFLIRDITVGARDDAHGNEITARVEQLAGIQVLQVSDRTFLLHLQQFSLEL